MKFPQKYHNYLTKSSGFGGQQGVHFIENNGTADRATLDAQSSSREEAPMPHRWCAIGRMLGGITLPKVLSHADRESSHLLDLLGGDPMYQPWAALKQIVTSIIVISTLLLGPVGAAGADWYDERLVVALSAAPPDVTRHARIYVWGDDGQDAQLVLLRDGTGSYTCVANGSASPHIGEPPFPLPHPFCADQHAWAFIQALWAEPNPQQPLTPLPQIPGLVWMLEGTRLDHSHAAQGETMPALETPPTQAHLLIMPLPTDVSVAFVPTVAEGNQPPSLGSTASKRPMEPLLIRIPAIMRGTLMAPTSP
jgi:hypothetical protein